MKKILPLIAALLVLLLAAMYFIQNIDSVGTGSAPLKLIEEPGYPALSLAADELFNIRKAILKSNIAPSDFERLVLASPSNASKDQISNMEVFNPEGSIRARLVNQRNLDSVTKVVNTEILYNVRRLVNADGSIEDTLFAIIVNPTLAACEDHANNTFVSGLNNQNHFLPTLLITDNIDIKENNASVVSDRHKIPNNSVCIQTPENKMYFFFPLLTRFKTSESEKWMIKL